MFIYIFIPSGILFDILPHICSDMLSDMLPDILSDTYMHFIIFYLAHPGTFSGIWFGILSDIGWGRVWQAQCGDGELSRRLARKLAWHGMARRWREGDKIRDVLWKSGSLTWQARKKPMQLENWKNMASGPVGAEWSSPLLQGIVELFRIPAELALDQQVHSAGVVPVVLQDKFLPWKGEEILRTKLACRTVKLEFQDV